MNSMIRMEDEKMQKQVLKFDSDPNFQSKNDILDDEIDENITLNYVLDPYKKMLVPFSHITRW